MLHVYYWLNKVKLVYLKWFKIILGIQLILGQAYKSHVGEILLKETYVHHKLWFITFQVNVYVVQNHEDAFFLDLELII